MCLGAWWDLAERTFQVGEHRRSGGEDMSEAETRMHVWEFPGGPVARTPCSQCQGPGSILGRELRSHKHFSASGGGKKRRKLKKKKNARVFGGEKTHQ